MSSKDSDEDQEVSIASLSGVQSLYHRCYRLVLFAS